MSKGRSSLGRAAGDVPNLSLCGLPGPPTRAACRCPGTEQNWKPCIASADRASLSQGSNGPTPSAQDDTMSELEQLFAISKRSDGLRPRPEVDVTRRKAGGSNGFLTFHRCQYRIPALLSDPLGVMTHRTGPRRSAVVHTPWRQAQTFHKLSIAKHEPCETRRHPKLNVQCRLPDASKG